MATPLINLELLGYFTPLFILILVFALMYAFLQHTKTFGDNKILHAIIALILGLIVIMFTSLTKLITLIAPWFTIFFIFIIFILMLYKIFGATDDQIRTVITKHVTVQWTIAILSIIIIIGALSAVFSQKVYEYDAAQTAEGGEVGEVITIGEGGATGISGVTATPSVGKNVSATLFHPKTLGLVFILLISALAIGVLTQRVTKTWPE